MTYLRLALRVLLLHLLAFGVASCSKSSPTDADLDTDRVRIVSIQPPLGATVLAGSTLAVSATLDYHLISASSGTISIVFEDQSWTTIRPTVPGPEALVTRGSGTVTLSGQIVVPAAGVSTVRVFFPLFSTGSTSTGTLDDVYYRVNPAP